MDNLHPHIEFVKSQAEFQRRQAIRFANEPKRNALHLGSAERFESLHSCLVDLQDKLDKKPTLFDDLGDQSNMRRISLSWEEVEGLPPELLEELSVSESDKTEFIIRSLIVELGGVASLDRILVALFRQSGEVTKRAALNQRLYRMVQKEMVYSVNGKKGVYSARPLTEEESEKLI
jgi:hypothetical protein